ncbi:twin-arginine translocase TatA/TatE family subunit [Microbacterium sp. SD291]|uniref:twin-arginine translocase TatA/TatE family subunit n=1 Tax=Microbacterium sp. SD291 TaxID=2782007 RepID=UPI001A96EEFF|nr:twin-arginine translocase TatA/TatE family subunit [Microbacterium sp. SD291]MBO0978991.1 twin-arginine translocase TatA/TatE family subunit [Microbacterium sp. SD291]
MFAGMQGWHLLIVLAVILLLFGAAKLPALAKSVGQSARVFKGEMKAMKEEDAPGTAASPSVAAEPTSVKDSGTDPETPPRA